MRTSTVRLTDGTRLPYVESGSRSGVPVVLLHAVGESWRSWSRLLGCLPADLRALAMTQRGHGDADKPAQGYRLGEAAADVVGVLDAVGIDRAVIAGTSSGGLVAQQVAADRPDRVTALLLVGSPHSLRGVPAPAWVRGADALTDPVPRSFARASVESFAVGRILPPDFVEQMVEDAARLPAGVWRAVVTELLEAEPPSETGRVAVPTVVLWGDRDEVLPRADQERMVASIPGAELRVYEGTGHLVLWEQPERVAADLVALVRGLSG